MFGDHYCETVQNPPFVIIMSKRNSDEVAREARIYGADIESLRNISKQAYDGKITVFTKLYKEYNTTGRYTIKCVKLTENTIVRKSFDTGLHLYLCRYLPGKEKAIRFTEKAKLHILYQTK